MVPRQSIISATINAGTLGFFFYKTTSSIAQLRIAPPCAWNNQFHTALQKLLHLRLTLCSIEVLAHGIILVAKDDPLSTGSFHAFVSRQRHATVGMRKHLYSVALVGLAYLKGTIRTSVIHQQQFEIVTGLAKHTFDGFP